MMYICNSCGNVFHEDEIVSWVEHHGEPHLRGEQWYGSPCCKDGFEEYVEDDAEEEDVKRGH